MLINAHAAGRSLYWQNFDVSAELSGDGSLHVREQQTIVFNGDWNGGERRFAVQPGPKFYRFNKSPVKPGFLHLD